MRLKTESIVKTLNSDAIHNQNCHAYLSQLSHLDAISKYLSVSLQQRLSQIKKAYDPQLPYGDLYTDFFDAIEKIIPSIYEKSKTAFLRINAIEQEIKLSQEVLEPSKKSKTTDQLNRSFFSPQRQALFEKIDSLTLEKSTITQNHQKLSAFILTIYNNDNNILPSTYQQIKTITETKTPSQNIERRISRQLTDQGDKINVTSISPAKAGSVYGRFTAMISDNFKPQHTTSIATVRHYEYKDRQKIPVEYRLGTQGQRHQGTARVSPLFECFLDIQAQNASDAKKQHPNAISEKQSITHIYFNNLGRDRTDSEGAKEKALTQVLEQLEEKHPNVAVITLPADKGLMSKTDYKKTKKTHDYQQVFNEFFHIAMEDKQAKKSIKDFHISASIRSQLFKDPETEIKALLEKSFNKMDIKPEDKLSSAQRQAVWFDFIKSELTNHIIKTLQPESINFSCKDGIDRGGVSSAYYNLMESFETTTPMNREEFDQALHAAPAMVKARGMNHHLNLIWNTIDQYVNTHYNELNLDKNKSWLIEWRDLNCPHDRVSTLLKDRVKQTIDEINAKMGDPSTNSTQKESLHIGLQLLKNIQKQAIQDVSGKRLLLETTAQTRHFCLSNIASQERPDQKKLQQYQMVSNTLKEKYPALKVLAGLMKAFVGTLLLLPSLGKTKKMIDSGLSTINAAISSERKMMQNDMKEFIEQVRKPKKLSPDRPENTPDAIEPDSAAEENTVPKKR